MPKTPKGQHRPADVISNAVKIAKIATGEIYKLLEEIDTPIEKEEVSHSPINSFAEHFNSTKEKVESETKTVSENKRKEVIDYLKNIQGFEGIDPFDRNLSPLLRIDAAILYIMSDGKQRNGKAIKAEMIDLFPNERLEEKIVARRAYTLELKRGMLKKQDMRGYYRILDKYNQSSINSIKSRNEAFAV